MENEDRKSRSKPALLRSQGIVRPLQPRLRSLAPFSIDIAQTREYTEEKELVRVDVMHPERSTWLEVILKEIQSQDLLTSHFALWRFRVVFNRMVVTKGPSLCAGFAAYVLERGILTSVKKIFRAAQSEGDLYIFPRGSSIPISKLGTCFRILHGLIVDIRTARFVCNALPDLLAVLEAAYFTAPLLVEFTSLQILLGDMDMKFVIEDDKKVCLSALMSLCTRLPDKDKTIIVSRERFLHQVLQDYLAGTPFSTKICMHFSGIFSALTETCPFSGKLFDATLEAAFKTLETSLEVHIISNSLSTLNHLLLKSAMSKDCDVFKMLEILSGSWITDNRLDCLLAAATCDNLDKGIGWQAVTLLTLTNAMDKLKGMLSNSGFGQLGPMSKDKCFEEILKMRPKAFARRQRLMEAFAANSNPIHEMQPDLRSRMASPDVSTLFERQKDNPSDPHPDKVYMGDRGGGKKPASRRCSQTECLNTESKPREFLMCGGCRLAVYCSPDCQKRAWKQGHKIHCRAGINGPKAKESK